MNHVIAFMIALLFSACSSVPQKTIVRPLKHQAPSPPKKRTLTLELLQQKSEEARKRLEHVDVQPWCYQHNGTYVVARGREIALAAYHFPSDMIDIVKIRLCFKSPEKLEILTKDYQVVWLRGNGITLFAFEIINRDSEKLILLVGKHAWDNPGEAYYYYPFTDDFFYKEVVQNGARALGNAIRNAQHELCALGVRSRAYPEMLLCEVFPDDLLMNIALIEQMDEDEFFKTCPNPNTLLPQHRIFNNCAEYTVYKALVHYARNKEHAFQFVGSRAGAIGPMQFIRPTYDDIAIKTYPEAKLMPDFETGARDLNNAIKAAICLLDRELSDMPASIQKIYQTNYRLGGLYPIAAYNGGLNRALCIFSNKKTETCRAARNAWRETTGYVAKYQGIWYILDSLQEARDYDKSEYKSPSLLRWGFI